MENLGKEHILSHSLSIFFFLNPFSHKAFNTSLCPEQPSPAPSHPIKTQRSDREFGKLPTEVRVTPRWTRVQRGMQVPGALRKASRSPVLSPNHMESSLTGAKTSLKKQHENFP